MLSTQSEGVDAEKVRATKGLSDKAKDSLQSVVNRLASGDLSPVVDVWKQRLSLPEDAPSRKWTFSNQVLAYAQTGCLDCRGYNQWKNADRQVQKGTHGAFILAPRVVKTENKKTGEEEPRVIGFFGVSVHPFANTEGDNDDAFNYAPKEPPPLMDVAQKMGVSVTWQPVLNDRNGDYSPTTDHINVGTHDVKTWFHELAHAAHKRTDEFEKCATSHKEAVAEIVATVLMDMYGLDDRTGNCWEYIKMFSENPIQAIQRAMSSVGSILEVLLDA